MRRNGPNRNRNPSPTRGKEVLLGAAAFRRRRMPPDRRALRCRAPAAGRDASLRARVRDRRARRRHPRRVVGRRQGRDRLPRQPHLRQQAELVARRERRDDGVGNPRRHKQRPLLPRLRAGREPARRQRMDRLRPHRRDPGARGPGRGDHRQRRRPPRRYMDRARERRRLAGHRLRRQPLRRRQAELDPRREQRAPRARWMASTRSASATASTTTPPTTPRCGRTTPRAAADGPDSGLTAPFVATATPEPTATPPPSEEQASAANHTDYDSDDDDLIEIANLAQLNAMRWDLDGDGLVTGSNQANFRAAFPHATTYTGTTALGCAATCDGYELKANLNFDTDGDGYADSGDTGYWNNGAGWTPIGDGTNAFNASFDGNNDTDSSGDGGPFVISNLFIDVSTTASGDTYAGLFGKLDSSANVHNVALYGASVPRPGHRDEPRQGLPRRARGLRRGRHGRRFVRARLRRRAPHRIDRRRRQPRPRGRTRRAGGRLVQPLPGRRAPPQLRRGRRDRRDRRRRRRGRGRAAGRAERQHGGGRLRNRRRERRRRVRRRLRGRPHRLLGERFHRRVRLGVRRRDRHRHRRVRRLHRERTRRRVGGDGLPPAQLRQERPERERRHRRRLRSRLQ